MVRFPRKGTLLNPTVGSLKRGDDIGALGFRVLGVWGFRVLETLRTLLGFKA